ncbi:hypothetical protein [Thalassotalea agarivorans]|uniref:EF-hand domain-containing protein n=1 Tax=Thalassotalea agarivorans TaxID=349064 RepID=A0A1I0GX93_THASX|nr:hypothetical protein [Thalassotalea agarivorans]SET75864.1 hypothetical protein SAMN05660429_02616 [Thalassotalea agarivorans]
MKTLLYTALYCFTLLNSSALFANQLNISDGEKSRFNQLDSNNDDALDNIEFRETTKGWMTKAGW